MELKRLGIDAGHGGVDGGASKNGLIERDINLVVATELNRIMSQYVYTKMTRVNNHTTQSIEDKCRILNNNVVDFAISIHHNAGGGIGYEIIHEVDVDNSIGDEFSKVLAKKFKSIGRPEHAIYSRLNSKGNDDFYGFIRGCHANAIIIEYAYVDSEDYKAIDTVDKLCQQARLIAEALIEFFNLKKKVIDMKNYESIIQEFSAKDDWKKLIEVSKQMYTGKTKEEVGVFYLLQNLGLALEKAYLQDK